MSDDLNRKINAAMLIIFMKNVEDKSARALMLQRYVQRHGPIPSDMRAKVIAALEGKDEEQV